MNSTTMSVPLIGIFNASFVRDWLTLLYDKYDKYWPDKLHFCPMLPNDMNVYNLSSSVKEPFETLLPDGEYRYEHRYWNDDDDNIFTKFIYEQFNTKEASFI